MKIKLLLIINAIFILVFCSACSKQNIDNKNENLEYDNIAWHAQKTFGWNCNKVIALDDKINTNGSELGDANLITQIKGYYQIATCSSGLKLRVYPRKDTYPTITNIKVVGIKILL
ncbi:MAG: hypothetical protein DKM23_03910 [Candidatus Melainabacteria bacterium]|mgnify:CR=1 FL=1|nr:MAG: hypothetical protein DKM23_03910 [Candidatus Melainabacteria bacterium]